ncbi:glycoside hydrolase family 127 protein [Rhizomicrobium palustre]
MAAFAALSGGTALAAPQQGLAHPVALKNVRLLPSPYRTAVEANLKYLLSLSADRFLHNYHKFAGLPVKGELYGGWEADTIAGEGLGHYLSALALMYAQTGNQECKTRIAYIVSEMAKVQAAQGDGYVAGFLRKRKDGTIVDGKEIFAEIAAGDIRSTGFDLNGAWSPLYNIHKVLAGLLDAEELVGNKQALTVCLGFARYLDKVFAKLSDAQMQDMLSCEYGGINESFAELYARTKDARWLKLAERIYDKKSLDPVLAGEDHLPNTHANTQIPKIIGLARIAEVGGPGSFKQGAAFFWDTVVHHHSFVIGGNGDREYFFAPDTTADHLTEQTCEHCGSYNMLKLTRHLYAWKPDAALFDYYERTQLNHILAAQNPKTGMFTYMTPMMSGAERGFSGPEDAFWCCVLSGMESHAKHGDSVYWESGNTFFVNLFIPSEVKSSFGAWQLQTRYPYEGDIHLKLNALHAPKVFALALRIPGWAESADITINGEKVEAVREHGYAVLRRTWKAGDAVTLSLPLALRLETAPGSERAVSILRGPMVMGADLGSAEKPFEGVAPALVGADLLAGIKPVAPQDAVYRTEGIGRPGELTLKPFYAQWEERSALYFNRYSEPEWAKYQAAYLAEQARLKDIAARSLDVMHLGEMQAEHDHALKAETSYPVIYRARNGRDARAGGFFSFEMAARKDGKDPGALMLAVTYWGGEVNRDFNIEVDGALVAHQLLTGQKPGEWLDLEYAIPLELTKGKDKITVRFVSLNRKSVGPVFGVRLFTAAPSGAK